MRKRATSIRANLLFYFCGLIFSSVVILGVILNFRTSQIILEYTTEEVSNGLSQIEKSVDERLTQATECFSSIMLDDTIKQSLKEKNDIDTSLGFAKASEVSKKLWLLKNSYPYVSAICIYDVNNQCFYHSENKIIYEANFETTELYKKCVLNGNYYSWEATANIPGLSLESNKGYLTCTLPIKENVKKEILGYTFICIDFEELFKYIDEFEVINSKNIFLLSEENRLLGAGEEIKDKIKNIDTDNFVDGTEKYLKKYSSYLCVKVSKNTGLKYGVLVPYKNIYTPILEIWKVAVICMLPILGMAFCLSFVFSKKMYQPIFTLIEHMKKVVIVEGEKTLIEEKRSDEFGILYESFNQMLIENGKLMKELEDEQEKQRIIQLRLFQEQINPHFLYNSLNSIYCLSNIYHIQEISDLSEALTKFYRLSLNKGQEMITIKNTILHTEYYIKIQNVRYRGRYKLAAQVNDELMDLKIPKLIVQPLIENAIEHGLKDVRYQAIIWLGISKEDNQLKISVKDKGCGISEIKKNEIQKILEGDIEDSQDIFALKNIHDRLKLYYGEKSMINIYSKLGKGTKVDIVIPLQNGGGTNV